MKSLVIFIILVYTSYPCSSQEFNKSGINYNLEIVDSILCSFYDNLRVFVNDEANVQCVKFEKYINNDTYIEEDFELYLFYHSGKKLVLIGEEEDSNILYNVLNLRKRKYKYLKFLASTYDKERLPYDQISHFKVNYKLRENNNMILFNTTFTIVIIQGSFEIVKEDLLLN